MPSWFGKLQKVACDVLQPRQIIIVGFMGTGKSSVGQELARILARRFVDLDDLIAQREGRSPGEIIEQDGESRFRELETKALGELLDSPDAQVIAAGGGAWASAENRELINSSKAFTVWLAAPFKLCWKRIKAGKEFRPLARSRDEAQRLYAARRPTYHLAAARVPVSDGENPGAIAEKIVELIAPKRA